MVVRMVFIYLVLCVVLAKTKDYQRNVTKDKRDTSESFTPQRRVKRSNYFDSPPPGATVYRRPSYGFPPRSTISYTPPPNYKMEADDPPYPQPPRSYGRKPEGLGDEDINNIVKYLSKQDLNKIITLAGRERNDFSKKVPNTERDRDYQTQVQSESYEKFSLNGPYLKANNVQDRPFQHSQEYYKPNSNNFKDVLNYVNTSPFMNTPDSQDADQNYQQQYLGNNGNLLKRQVPTQPYSQEAVQQNPINDVLHYLNTANSQDSSQNYQQLYLGNNLQKRQTNSQLYSQETVTRHENYGDKLVTEHEADLPRPVNLREDTDEAIVGAQSQRVASVTRPDSSYKVEGFGDLPVMDYHSKMFSVSSYNVPHYTITSNLYSKSPGAKAPQVEPAPPPSEAKEQSDAHLKAVKIWSHRSKGQAYTLHQDGTLSLEKPLRPRRGPYGH